MIDFGISKGLSKQDFDKMTTGVKGTYHYLSPELMKKKVRDQTYIDLFACDMWALGIVLYQMVYHKLPFDISTKANYKNQVTDPSFEIGFPESPFKDLLKSLLQRDVSKRMKSDELVR